MNYGDDWEQFRRFWHPWSPFEARGSVKHRWQAYLPADARIVQRNELETRRLLAQDVYRVPEESLDDVIRVRLADLN